MQEAPILSGTYREDWQPAVDEKSLALESDTVMPIKPQYEATAKESRFIKAPTIEIETPSSSSASSSDDEEKIVKPDRTDVIKEKSSSSSSSSDEDEKDTHETESKSLVEKEVKPVELGLLEGETDLDAVMLKTEEQIITTETATLETVEIEEPEFDSNLDSVIRELKKIEKGELPELPLGYHYDGKQDSIIVENVLTSETSQIESSEIILDVSKEPVDKSERDVDKDLKGKSGEKSSSSSSSSDDEEFYEASAETPDRDKLPKYKTPDVAESASIPDQSKISELSLEPDLIRSEPTEEFMIPPKVQETDRSEPGKKTDEEPVHDDIKHTQKKKVTFVEPDKESDSSESEDSDSTAKEDSKSSGSDSDSEEHKHKEDSTVDKSDELKKNNIQTTDLDADFEENEPKLLSYADQSEPKTLSYIETVSAGRKGEIIEQDKTERSDIKEKSDSSSSSAESEDSENEPTSYDISKDSGHSSSDDESGLSKKEEKEQENPEINSSSEIRYKGTIITEMIEVTQVSKQELVEGETDLDAVMLSPETKIDSGQLDGEEEAEVDTSLDSVIRELKKIEKGELPELPPGYGTDEPIITSEASNLESTQYTPGKSVGGSDFSAKFETDIDSVLMDTQGKSLSDKDAEYVEIPKHSETTLVETNIDDLVEELEATVKSSAEKERKLSSSSSESDEQADKEKGIEGEVINPDTYMTPDMGTFDDKMVIEHDSEMKIDEPVIVDDPDKFICIYPVPKVAPRAESPELIPVSIVTEGVPDEKQRRSSTSSSSSSDHGYSGQPIILEEEKPWQCIYPIPPSSETTEQEPEGQSDDDIKEKIPSRKSSTSSSGSSDYDYYNKDIKPAMASTEQEPDSEEKDSEIKIDKPIIIEEEKPWQCIYPIAPSAEFTEQPEFREDEPHEISVDDQPIVITEVKPWQCIYPIAPDMQSAEIADKEKDSSSSESETEDKEMKGIELEKIEIGKEKSSSSSSSSDEEDKGKHEPETEIIKPIAPSSELSEQPEFREEEPHDILVDDQPIDVKEEKPWRCVYPIEPRECIYPIAPSTESTEQPVLTEDEPDEQITDKVPSRKSSTSSSSSSDEDDTVPGVKQLSPRAETETTRVESIIVHDKPAVIKKSDIPKASLDDEAENKASSSDDEDENLKFITTVSARQAKEKALVTDLDAESAEPTKPIKRGSSSSSSDDDGKGKTPVTDLDEDIVKKEEPSVTVREKSRSRSSSESSSSSSDDDEERKPKHEEPADEVILPKSLETDLDADEPVPDTDELNPKEGLETDIDAVEPEPVVDKADKPKSLPVSDVMETDLDAPDDDIMPEAEPVVESIQPLHSPDVGFAPKNYPEIPFETNVDTTEPEYTAYSIKSAIPVETPESEIKPPEDEVYCETSFTVVRRTKVKQTYASDETDRQPTMVEQAVQQSGKTPAITDSPDTTGKRHRTESLSDEEEEEHPSKRQEFEPTEDPSPVFGEDEAAPPAREYILLEPTILHDKTEVRTEHYRKEMPYVPCDDALHTTGDESGILFA